MRQPKLWGGNKFGSRFSRGYSICVLFLKLFERIYAPLTAGFLKPFAGDRNLAPDKRCQLDRLYPRPTDDLLSAVGLKTAA